MRQMLRGPLLGSPSLNARTASWLTRILPLLCRQIPCQYPLSYAKGYLSLSLANVQAPPSAVCRVRAALRVLCPKWMRAKSFFLSPRLLYSSTTSCLLCFGEPVSAESGASLVPPTLVRLSLIPPNRGPTYPIRTTPAHSCNSRGPFCVLEQLRIWGLRVGFPLLGQAGCTLPYSSPGITPVPFTPAFIQTTFCVVVWDSVVSAPDPFAS